MTRALWQRLLQAGLVAVMVGMLTFVLVRALPGDAAYRIAAGRYGYDRVDSAAAEAVRQELALDQPVWMALGQWLGDLLTLNLGRSQVTGAPVISELAHQLGHSVDLALSAIVVSLLLGLPIGLIAGWRPGGVVDRLSLAVSVVLRSLPPFVLGLVLVLLLAVGAGWLPAAGHGGFAHRILPALTLGLGLAAVSSRVARDAMAAVVRSPFYQFGRVKGLGEWRVFIRHGLRNAAVPMVAYLGVQFVYLVEGVVVVETLFAWPGVGHALVHAIVARDVPMIQGAALVMGLGFVLLNALVDAACFGLDPRKRLA